MSSEASSGDDEGDGSSGGSGGEGRDDRGERSAPTAGGRVRASLLWGLVGALAFLVLVQGFELLGGEPVAIGVKVGVAVLVGVTAAGLSYVFEERLAGRRP